MLKIKLKKSWKNKIYFILNWKDYFKILDFNWFIYFYFLLFQINLIFVVKLVFVAFWFEGAGVNGVGNVSGKSTWGGGGFNKAGFDGASEKPVWIWNFTGGVFWEDFDFEGDLLWWRWWDLWWREWEWRWFEFE